MFIPGNDSSDVEQTEEVREIGAGKAGVGYFPTRKQRRHFRRLGSPARCTKVCIFAQKLSGRQFLGHFASVREAQKLCCEEFKCALFALWGTHILVLPALRQIPWPVPSVKR